jgi:hypothetical protein
MSFRSRACCIIPGASQMGGARWGGGGSTKGLMGPSRNGDEPEAGEGRLREDVWSLGSVGPERPRSFT